MQVLVTLDEPLGADLGPFSLSSNVGNVIPSIATRSELINGLEVTVDDSSTQIIILDTNGKCETSVLTLDINGIPTVTTFKYQWFHTNTGTGNSTFFIDFQTNTTVESIATPNTSFNSNGFINNQIPETGITIGLQSTDAQDNLNITVSVVGEPDVSTGSGNNIVSLEWNFQVGKEYTITATCS